MEAIAKVKNQRGSAKKVRLVADLIRNKKVDEAKNILYFSQKRAADTILEILNAAIANAQNQESKIQIDKFYINKIFVDEGQTLKRYRPRARGMADLIRKRTYQLTISIRQLPDENNEERSPNGSKS